MVAPDDPTLARLGLPAGVTAVLFDLDGVLTRTATVHRGAWKDTFDPVLAAHGQPPFTDDDYARYVDGKPRRDGVRDLLASRGIHPPEGDPDDPPQADTVAGIGNRKNELLLRNLETGGVETYEGSVAYVRACRDAGLTTAVVTASANGEKVLAAAGLTDLFAARVDGVTAARDGLAGKPAPDTFLAGARAVGVAPEHAVVVEDALAGVAAGRAGGFALVIGVDRHGHADALREHGADVVVDDLADLLDAR